MNLNIQEGYEMVRFSSFCLPTWLIESKGLGYAGFFSGEARRRAFSKPLLSFLFRLAIFLFFPAVVGCTYALCYNVRALVNLLEQFDVPRTSICVSTWESLLVAWLFHRSEFDVPPRLVNAGAVQYDDRVLQPGANVDTLLRAHRSAILHAAPPLAGSIYRVL